MFYTKFAKKSIVNQLEPKIPVSFFSGQSLAHVGIHGNEVADFIAKKGSALDEGSTNKLLTP